MVSGSNPIASSSMRYTWHTLQSFCTWDSLVSDHNLRFAMDLRPDQPVSLADEDSLFRNKSHFLIQWSHHYVNICNVNTSVNIKCILTRARFRSLWIRIGDPRSVYKNTLRLSDTCWDGDLRHIWRKLKTLISSVARLCMSGKQKGWWC